MPNEPPGTVLRSLLLGVAFNVVNLSLLLIFVVRQRTYAAGVR